MSVPVIQSELIVELSDEQQQLLSGGQTSDGQEPDGQPSGGGQFGGRPSDGGTRGCPPYFYCGGYYYYPDYGRGGRRY